MTETVDPVTSALAGHLPFYLLVAAVLTWPVALTILRLCGLLRAVAGAAADGPRPEGRLTVV